MFWRTLRRRTSKATKNVMNRHDLTPQLTDNLLGYKFPIQNSNWGRRIPCVEQSSAN
jgi:hypothetical protein